MRQLNDYSDVRNRGFCIHCGGGLDDGNGSGDHVPTRALLDRPHPNNLPNVEVCGDCNHGFSEDEECLVALIACVLSGSMELERDRFPVAAGILDHSAALKDRIERMRRVRTTPGDDLEMEWAVESDRVANVVVKNACGHILHDLGDPLHWAPHRVEFVPLQMMPDDRRDEFERGPARVAGWPEVGSRMMQRLVLGDLELDWVIVQWDVYRYMVVQRAGETLVRSVIREYLATEVSWSDEGDDLASYDEVSR